MVGVDSDFLLSFGCPEEKISMVEASNHLESLRFILKIPCGCMSCYLSFLKSTPPCIHSQGRWHCRNLCGAGARSLHGLDNDGEHLWWNRVIT